MGSKKGHSRRGFIGALGAFGVGTAGLSAAGALFPRKARAATWGGYPSDIASLAVPEELRAKNVLEIFMNGGISPWETFYTVDEPDFGQAKGEMWWTFQDGSESVQSIYDLCYPGNSGVMLQDFMPDENGVMVKLGPFLDPFRGRADIIDRMRMHVMAHDLMPHELAIPYSLTGYRLGNPKAAGLGTAVQHYFLTHGAGSDSPLSYLIYPLNRRANDRFSQAAAVGRHPSYARPLTLHVGSDTSFLNALARNSLGDKPNESDAVLRHYISRYRDRLAWNGEGSPLRSSAFNEYEYSADALQKSSQLLGLFTPEVLAPESGGACGEMIDVSESHMQLKLAVHLLQRPGSEIKQITVVDQGFYHPFDDAYDSHRHHIAVSAPNLSHFFSTLVSMINVPGENDPTKIDLDQTMIVLNTEFGRSPGVQHENGRNHHPAGYVTAMFGGPIGKAQKGIVGSIGPNGNAMTYLQPSETRAAVLAALGIYPLAPEAYAVSDFLGVTTESEAALKIRQTVLGIA